MAINRVDIKRRIQTRNTQKVLLAQCQDKKIIQDKGAFRGKERLELELINDFRVKVSKRSPDIYLLSRDIRGRNWKKNSSARTIKLRETS